MKKLLPLFILITYIISACTNPGQESLNRISITDALGREILLDEPPGKIVIAGKQTPMLANFFYLFETANQKISAIERRSQSEDDFLKIIDVDIESKYTLARDAGVEQIAPLKPDVVILKSSMRETVGLGLEEVEIPVIYVDFETVDQIYRDIAVIAVLLDEEERGKELINQYQAFKSTIDAWVGQSSESPSVVIVQAQGENGNFEISVPSARFLQTMLIEELGATALWLEAAQSGGWTTVNIEQLLNWDPEYLFVINYQGYALSIVDELKRDPLWQNLQAVKEKRVYAFAYDFLSWDQPDPRWILGYAWLASCLYPDWVNANQVIGITKTFYEKFYDLNESEFAEIIEPRIRSYFEQT